MLRSIHDGLLRIFPGSRALFSIPAVLAITLTAFAFIMPHVAEIKIDMMTTAYFITSAGFSLVYLTTRSMVSAMISHSLQSCCAFSNLLYYGHGGYALSPVIYAIAFLCPVIDYFIGTWMGGLFAKK